MGKTSRTRKLAYRGRWSWNDGGWCGKYSGMESAFFPLAFAAFLFLPFSPPGPPPHFLLILLVRIWTFVLTSGSSGSKRFEARDLPDGSASDTCVALILSPTTIWSLRQRKVSNILVVGLFEFTIKISCIRIKVTEVLSLKPSLWLVLFWLYISLGAIAFLLIYKANSILIIRYKSA